MTIPPLIAQTLGTEEIIYGVFFLIWVVFKLLGSLFGKNEEEEEAMDAPTETARVEDIMAEIRRKREERAQAEQAVESTNQPAQFQTEPHSEHRTIETPVNEDRKHSQTQVQETQNRAAFDFEKAWEEQKQRLSESKQTAQNIAIELKHSKKKYSLERNSTLIKKLKNKNSLQEAIILSEILGPPQSEKSW